MSRTGSEYSEGSVEGSAAGEEEVKASAGSEEVEASSEEIEFYTGLIEKLVANKKYEVLEVILKTIPTEIFQKIEIGEGRQNPLFYLMNEFYSNISTTEVDIDKKEDFVNALLYAIKKSSPRQINAKYDTMPGKSGLVDEKKAANPLTILPWLSSKKKINAQQYKKLFLAFLNNKVNLDIRDQRGYSFLHLACHYEKNPETLPETLNSLTKAQRAEMISSTVLPSKDYILRDGERSFYKGGQSPTFLLSGKNNLNELAYFLGMCHLDGDLGITTKRSSKSGLNSIDLTISKLIVIQDSTQEEDLIKQLKLLALVSYLQTGKRISSEDIRSDLKLRLQESLYLQGKVQPIFSPKLEDYSEDNIIKNQRKLRSLVYEKDYYKTLVTILENPPVLLSDDHQRLTRILEIDLIHNDGKMFPLLLRLVDHFNSNSKDFSLVSSHNVIDNILKTNRDVAYAIYKTAYHDPTAYNHHILSDIDKYPKHIIKRIQKELHKDAAPNYHDLDDDSTDLRNPLSKAIDNIYEYAGITTGSSNFSKDKNNGYDLFVNTIVSIAKARNHEDFLEIKKVFQDITKRFKTSGKPISEESRLTHLHEAFKSMIEKTLKEYLKFVNISPVKMFTK